MTTDPVTDDALHDHAPAFDYIVRTRRSVRKFTGESIPEEVVQTCIEWGTLAPNSSNLLPWMFHWVRAPELKAKLAHACMGQNAAKTASDMIVVTVRPGVWRKHAKWNRENHPLKPMPKIVSAYYGKLVYLLYGTGPFGVLAPFKWLLLTTIGRRTPIIREPLTPIGRRLWAVKTAALACENIMLGFRAYGYDTCPMEGYDRNRVRALLKLPRSEYIVMIIAAGPRLAAGIHHEQYRLPTEVVIRRY
jgi:nitroreductase